MRTVIIVVIGCVLGGIMLVVARQMRLSSTLTVAAFAILWLAVCGWNMAVGISHGYGVGEEMPFLLANFILPMLSTWFISKKVFNKN